MQEGELSSLPKTCLYLIMASITAICWKHVILSLVRWEGQTTPVQIPHSVNVGESYTNYYYQNM